LEVRLGPVAVILVAACIWGCKAAAFGGVTMYREMRDYGSVVPGKVP